MMLFLSNFKSTVLLWFLVLATCGNDSENVAERTQSQTEPQIVQEKKEIVVAANRTEAYLPILKGKKIAVVANQTSVIFKTEGHTHLVDSLLSLGVDIKHVFAPEHGFRGNFDAGEHVNNSKDIKTGLELISLHGKNL